MSQALSDRYRMTTARPATGQPAIPQSAPGQPLPTGQLAASPAPSRPTRRTSGPRVPPQRDPHFAELPLADIRSYRQKLLSEEDRVSYWRRILQARIDTLTHADPETAPGLEHLRDVLDPGRVQAGRKALVRIAPRDDIPPLPDLARLWDCWPAPTNPTERARLVADLLAAERELSSYRAALHVRLAAATAELIARYRERPARCLEVLPL